MWRVAVSVESRISDTRTAAPTSRRWSTGSFPGPAKRPSYLQEPSAPRTLTTRNSGTFEPASTGSCSAGLSRDRCLGRIDRAGLGRDVRRRPQAPANRQLLLSLRTPNQAHHLARVLPHALPRQPVRSASGLIEGEGARCPGILADTAHELHRTACIGCGGWRRLSRGPARKNEAEREDDGGCSEHVFLPSGWPGHCTATMSRWRASRSTFFWRSSGARPGW